MAQVSVPEAIRWSSEISKVDNSQVQYITHFTATSSLNTSTDCEATPLLWDDELQLLL